MRTLIILSILCFGKVFSQNPPQKVSVSDSLFVEGIVIETSQSKGLSGLMIEIDLKQTIQIDHNLDIHYSIDGSPYTREYREMRPLSTNQLKIFHPFAQLYQSKGKYESIFHLDNIVDPDKQHQYEIDGQLEQNAISIVPTIHSIKIKVNYVTVSETTPKGKAWDYNFFKTNKTDTYPDLNYTIESTFNELSRGIFGGQFYSAHKQKNTIISSWPYFSEQVYYCDGDELRICIKDMDTLIHDVIGCISIEELLTMKNTENLKFGSVTDFNCKVEIN
jgi:hypothetical protein